MQTPIAFDSYYRRRRNAKPAPVLAARGAG